MLGFAIAFLAIYLSANGYLLWRIYQATEVVPVWLRVAIVVLLSAIALMLFATFGLRDAGLPEGVMRAMFNIGSVWLVFLLYATLAVAFFDVVRLLFPAFRFGLPIALLITIFILQIGYVRFRNPRVVEYSFSSEKIATPKRIVAISDVHLGYGTDRKALESYVELINAQRADMVLIVGDLIDNSLHPVVEQRMGEVLDAIDAPDGLFMVAGNHEYISDIRASQEFLSTTKITLLRDSVVRVGDIQIVGRDDMANRHRKSLDQLALGEGYTIVLDHQPTSIAESVAHSADLHLSGHTHRGQVWPISWLTDAIYEQSYGYRRWQNSDVIVTSGLSLWGPPFRIGSQSELLVITINPLGGLGGE